MGAGRFTEREMVHATTELLPHLEGDGPVSFEPAQSPVSSPLQGWYDGEPVYLRGKPEVVSEERKTIRRWNDGDYVVTIVSDFSEAPRRIDRSIEVRKRHQAGDGTAVSGT